MRVLILLFIIFFISCSDKQELPSGILSPEKMELVLWDYIRADVYATDFIRQDTTKDAAVENHYFEYPGMFHDWMVVTQMKESGMVLKQISKFMTT